MPLPEAVIACKIHSHQVGSANLQVNGSFLLVGTGFFNGFFELHTVNDEIYKLDFEAPGKRISDQNR